MGIFSKRQQNFKSEGPYNWENLLNTIYNNGGNYYFENYPSHSVSEVLEKIGSDPKYFELEKMILPGFDNWEIRENFLPFINEDFASPENRDGWRSLSANESKMISKFSAATTKLNLQLTQTDSGDGSVMVFGPWQTERNNSFIQYGHFYKDTSENEVLFWKVDVLHSTFGSEDKEFRVEQLVTHQAALFQAAFFLAENQFPSTSKLLNLGRQLTFSENFPIKFMPRPVLQFRSPGGYAKAKKNHMIWVDSPFVTSIGYEISNQLTEEQLSNALVVVMDSFSKIFSTLEDGYLNYNLAKLDEEEENEEGFLMPYEVVMGTGSNTYKPTTL